MNTNLYRNRTDNREALTAQIFAKFCDAVGHGNENEFARTLYGRYTVEDFSYSDDWKYWNVHGYFLEKVVPHKVEVYDAGMWLAKNDWFLPFIGEPLELWQDNLWLHDLSKFSANEALGYALHDFKSDKYDLSFEMAWAHHKNHNEHHPEYWLNPSRSGEIEPIQMPKIYIAEMVADWIGAGKTYDSPLSEWIPGNLPKFLFHPETAQGLEFLLLKIGIFCGNHAGRLTVNGIATANI